MSASRYPSSPAGTGVVVSGVHCPALPTLALPISGDVEIRATEDMAVHAMCPPLVDRTRACTPGVVLAGRDSLKVRGGNAMAHIAEVVHLVARRDRANVAFVGPAVYGAADGHPTGGVLVVQPDASVPVMRSDVAVPKPTSSVLLVDVRQEVLLGGHNHRHAGSPGGVRLYKYTPRGVSA